MKMWAKFFLVGIAALAPASTAFEIRQVSFNDLYDPELDSDARDAKIYEDGENGSHCFVYTSQANYDLPSTYSFDDFKIWETCGVFDGDGPMANELLRGDDTGSGTKYTFADTSGDGSKTCYIEDAPPTGFSAELLSRPSGSITVLQDTKLSEGTRSSKRCDLSRDGTVVVFETDDATLTNDDRAAKQEHVVYTQDEGNTFIRLVPDEFYNATDKKESIWGVVSGDGSFVAFHSNIGYPGASLTASETYLWRESDKNIHKVTNLKGKECNKTLIFETLVDLYGIEKLIEQNLATEDKLGNAQTQCNAFAAAGELSQTGTIDVKDNPASISDDGRFVTFTTNFDSATLRGTLEKPTPVSQRHLFLFDSKLGITWQFTDEGESVGGIPVDEPKLEKFGCPRASKSYGGGAVVANRTECVERNQIRQSCCWQRPSFYPVVTQRISGNGESIVYSGDLGPVTDTGIQLDYEIVHYHILTGTRTQITDTRNRDLKDFFPSISRMGSVVAWTSQYDYTTNQPITKTPQIFASKLIMGCSRDTTAANYEASPDVEVCCEFDTLNLDNNSNTAVTVTFGLMGDPDTLKAHVAFSNIDSDSDEKWCAAYVEQVRNDVACSLAVPKESVVIDDDASDCNNWTKDQIEVTLLLNENPIKDVSDICTEIRLQYDDTNSKLWTSYLTKTLKLENTPICKVASVSPSESPSTKPSVEKSTNVNVNVDPGESNMDIEQGLLDKTVNTLGGRRLGATVSLLDEQDDHEHRKLIRTQTIQVSTGTATIRVQFIADISCVDIFGDLTPPKDKECRDFSISVTLTGGGQDDVDDLIEEVDVAINTGTFTTDLGFCTVSIKDQVDTECFVVDLPAPTAPSKNPTKAPTRSPSKTPTSNPTQVPTDKPSKKKKSTKSKKTKSSKS